MHKVLLVIFLSISSTGFSQIEETVYIENDSIQYDLDNNREGISFDTNRIQEFKEDSDFDYTEYVPEENIWTKFKKWLEKVWLKFIHWLFGVEEVTGFWANVLTFLPYLIILGTLFLIIKLLMRVNPGKVLLEEQPPPQVILSEDEDIIQNKDISLLIQEAIQANNYRLATRYYYLLVLKRLSEKELIQWESQKTNSDYLKELSDQTIKDHFKGITKLYDFIWYGSFTIDENAYKKIEQQFISITNTI